MDGWVDRRMDGWKDGLICMQMGGWNEGWMERWADGWVDG